jgi:hypothetical protein
MCSWAHHVPSWCWWRCPEVPSEYAGVNLAEITKSDGQDEHWIHILNYQNIVFEDSVLDGLEPSVDAGIINVSNSKVVFVRLTVKSCTLSGEFSGVLFLGSNKHAESLESLSIQDSRFMENRGNTVLGMDGALIWQGSGRLLINNTNFTDNTAAVACSVYTHLSDDTYSVYGLTMHACTFRNNSCGTTACVCVQETARSEVSDCHFESNRADAGHGVLQVLSPYFRPSVFCLPCQSVPQCLVWGLGFRWDDMPCAAHL